MSLIISRLISILDIEQVFLQSDVEAVAIRMKEQFLRYGKGKLDFAHGQCNGQSEWLEENPFGVRSDWEKHVLERGDPMYRMMFSKSSDIREVSAANDVIQKDMANP